MSDTAARLSTATVHDITDELKKRGMQFALVCSHEHEENDTVVTNVDGTNQTIMQMIGMLEQAKLQFLMTLNS